jgi:hypothetical protein
MDNFEKKSSKARLTGLFLKLVLSTALLFACLLIPENAVAQLTAVFSDSSQVCYKHKDSYYTRFRLFADADQVKLMSEKAATMPETMIFDYKKKKDSSFECRIRFHYPPDNNYVLKILRFLEIGLIDIDGTLIPLDQYKSQG